MPQFDNLVDYYNKFNEEKRLQSRHGRVEWEVTMYYLLAEIEKMMKETGKDSLKILDIGAGTGAYSVPLAKLGHEVTAVEYVNHNLGLLKKYAKDESAEVKAYQGDARELSLFPRRYHPAEYDITLVFGPMYHLFGDENKVKVLEEAKRVTRENGKIFVAYVMNEYSVLTFAFKGGNLKESIRLGKLDKEFHVRNQEEDLYDYVRLEDVDRVNKLAKVERIGIFSPDGPANLMRSTLRELDEEDFQTFIEYQKKMAPRKDLLGAAGHIVDILNV